MTTKESEDDKQGHELSSNLLLLKCVPQPGGCLELDFSLVVEGTRFSLESSGVRLDSPGDKRKHHCL